MLSRIAGALSLLILLLAFSAGRAEQYDYAIIVDFDRTTFESRQSIFSPIGTTFVSTDSETDQLNASGNWYYAGLSDDDGPRARAEFVDRASYLNIEYSHVDQTVRFIQTIDNPAPPLPPTDLVFGSESDFMALSIRHVDRDSGWFGNVGLLQSESSPNGQTGAANISIDVTGWSAGVGKYLLDSTAVSLDYSQVNGNAGADSSALALNLIHLGDIGETWQYAIDVAFSRSDPDTGPELDTWSAAFALYPTQDIEFGVSVIDVSADSDAFTNRNNTSIAGFASWFVTPNVRLSARYGVDDVELAPTATIGGSPTRSSADQDTFGISATVRF